MSLITIISLALFLCFEFLASIQDIKTMKVKNYCHYIPMLFLVPICIYSYVTYYELKEIVGMLFCLAFVFLTKNMRGGADNDSMICFVICVYNLNAFVFQKSTYVITMMILLTFGISIIFQLLLQLVCYLKEKQKKKIFYIPSLFLSYVISIAYLMKG